MYTTAGKKLKARKDQTNIFSSFPRSRSEVCWVFLRDSLAVAECCFLLWLFLENFFWKETNWLHRPKNHYASFHSRRMLWRYSYHSQQFKCVESKSVCPITVKSDGEHLIHRGIIWLTPIASQLLGQVQVIVPIARNVLGWLTICRVLEPEGM